MARTGIPVRVHGMLSIGDISLRNDFCDRTFLCEHILAVPPNDQAGNNDEQIGIIGLRVRKNRVHQREVEKRRQQNAAT